MYRCKTKVANLSKATFNKKQLHLVCKVDQFNAQPFNKNQFGWQMNSIAAMAKAVNYSEYLAIAQQIVKQPKQFNLPDGVSLKEALSLCRPRMCQSPAELDLFAEQLANLDMDKMNDAYLKALKDIKVDEPLQKPAASTASADGVQQ